MQTFLPYPQFSASAKVLDRQRLGKQRVETLQIMTALLEGRGWVNHPATKMWRGYEWALLNYQKAVCQEWTSRGYKDTCFGKTLALYCRHIPSRQDNMQAPPWLGNTEFHLSHMSNLIRKDRMYMADFPGVVEGLPYIWPVA